MKKQNHFDSPVIASSGMMGFYGEGYPYHKIFRFLFPFLFSFRWITFQSKTATADERVGNMELKSDGVTPVEFNPKCISENLIKGVGVNNVSLSNMGIFKLLQKGIWQEMTKEIHLSVMLLGVTSKERTEEAIVIRDVFILYKSEFEAKKIFLHWNISCPNTGHDAQNAFIESFMDEYNILSQIGWPIIVKVAWDFPYNIAKKLNDLECIYGFDAINTIPFDAIPYEDKGKYFKYEKFFYAKSYISPLDKYQEIFKFKGRGGVSGKPIRKYALKWIIGARANGINKPIIGGGGILNPYNVWQFKKAGATAISPGSITFLRPWNLLPVTLTAKFLFRNGH